MGTTRTLLLTALCAALFTARVACAAVTADPSAITLSAPEKAVAIKLNDGTKAIGGAAIKGYTFNVDDHTYENMVSVKPTETGVDVTPTEEAQVGSYDLTINTTAGAVLIKVNMPLDEAPDSLKNQAEAQGMTVDELLIKNGVAKPLAREKVTIEAPGPYEPGSTFRLLTPCPDDRDYEWRVNGKVVMTGHGPEPFEYTFGEAGTYVLEYRDHKPGVTATGKATITVEKKAKQ